METLENIPSTRSSIGVSVFMCLRHRERGEREREVREADRERKNSCAGKRDEKHANASIYTHTHTYLDDGIIGTLRTLTHRAAQTVREILQSLRSYRV